MKALIKLIIVTIFSYSLAHIMMACSEEADCSMTTRAMLQCNIYSIDPETGVAYKDTLDSLTITAYGTDSIILNNQKEVINLSLPLRYTTDSTVLVFHYDRRYKDTLTIHQENTPYFISMDCGYQMKQSVTNIRCSHHRLDSVYITNKEAGTNGTENIKLFY